MKKTDFLIIFIFTLFLSSLGGARLGAQEIVPEGYILVDSLVYRMTAAADTSLVGKDVFLSMPVKQNGAAGVVIRQSDAVENSVRMQISTNEERRLSGYRVRIFFDNKQTARVESEDALKRFEGIYHDVPAYRTYANPYFKVTVGDFRTRSEAVRCLERIRHDFPSAFVVKENIEYPVLDKENAYVVDTVKVLRPKVSL